MKGKVCVIVEFTIKRSREQQTARMLAAAAYDFFFKENANMFTQGQTCFFGVLP